MKRLLAGLGLLIAASVPLPATAALTELSQLFVFGDSLSDGGNSGLLTQATAGLTFPPFPYADGRYSNGPTAVEYLWNSYNGGNPGGFTPSLAGGTNFAIGGSTSGVENFNVVNGSVPDPLKPIYTNFGAARQLQQFAQYVGANGPFDPTTSLFVVWLFPNDVFYNGQTGLLPTPIPNSPGGANVVANGIANILTLVQTLHALGARNFLVPNLADLGTTPQFLGTPQAPVLSQLTALFNANLEAQLDLLDAALPGKIVQFDIAELFARTIANPSAFGFANVTERCVDNLLNGRCNPSSWLFWDGVHPTTAGHAIIGTGFRAAVPEPDVLALLLVATGVLVIQRVRRSRNAMR